MTDDLRTLAQPLLDDPPHPAPPLDELRARVDRRRARRARAVGAASVAVVVLVVAIVAALPRSSQLDVAGDPTTTSTQPPPPFTPGPVHAVVTPESAPMTTERTIELRNDGTEPYEQRCADLYDVFRWDGSEWAPIALLELSGGVTVVVPYRVYTDNPLCSSATIDAGSSRTLTFAPDRAVATDATSPSGFDVELTAGSYELREPVAPGLSDADPLPLGRFQITDEPSTTEPPPLEPEPVQLAVSPASAPLAQPRTLEVRNTSDVGYIDCSLRFDLFRWDGTTWVPDAILAADTDPPYLDEVGRAPTDGQCEQPSTVAAGTTTALPLDLAALPRYEHGGTIPADRRPLAPGWYELRSPASVARGGSPRASGRFEITDGQRTADPKITELPTEPPTGPTTTGGPADPAALPVTDSVVDLYPGADLTPAGEVRPGTITLVDRDTVSLTWFGACNTPATEVAVRATADVIVLRLRVGTFPVIDCVGEPDQWTVTFDLPVPIRGRRVVARAEALSAETVARNAVTDDEETGWSWPRADATPVSFQVFPRGSDGPITSAWLRPPYPLVSDDADGATCAVASEARYGVVTPEVRVAVPAAPGDPACDDATLTIAIEPGNGILSPP